LPLAYPDEAVAVDVEDVLRLGALQDKERTPHQVVVYLGDLAGAPHHCGDREGGLGVQCVAGVSVSGAFSFRCGEQLRGRVQLGQDTGHQPGDGAGIGFLPGALADSFDQLCEAVPGLGGGGVGCDGHRALPSSALIVTRGSHVV
jgi:hypothetical protein